MPYPALFRAGQLGSIRLPSRLVMPAMHLGFSSDGEVNERILAFYRARARGGVALVIVGGMPIGPEAGNSDMISAAADERTEGLRRLTGAIHEGPAFAAAQLYHAGRYAHSRLIDRLPLAPSAIPSRLTHETPRPMDHDDIQRVLGEYAAAARRCQDAGFDAVEILGSAGYLIAQFLSPLTNQRDDEYGGSVEARMRFGLEVLAAVRGAVGQGYPIIYRIGGSDFMPGGNGVVEAKLFAAALARSSADAISVTGGWHESEVAQLAGRVPPGAFAYLAGQVRRAVAVPVLLANRINDPRVAERVLFAGAADFVCMGRALIADPMLPAKAKDPALGPIRHCVACNQGCFDAIVDLQPVSCMVNPQAGREREPEPPLPAQRRRVVVVGAGPAGLQAAVTAAGRGHQVVLLERTARTGGQVRLAAAIPGRADMAALVDDLTATALHLGVDLRLGTNATPALLRELAPEALVIACGAAPQPLGVPGADLPHVVQAWDVIAGQVLLSPGEVVIIGGGGTGLDLALLLGEAGALSHDEIAFLVKETAEPLEALREAAFRSSYRLTIVEQRARIGRGMGRTARFAAMTLLEKMGVRLLPRHQVERIEPGAVLLRPPGNAPPARVAADHVVLAAGLAPERGLLDGLENLSPACQVVGDCREVRNSFEALREGYQAGLAT